MGHGADEYVVDIVVSPFYPILFLSIVDLLLTQPAPRPVTAPTRAPPWATLFSVMIVMVWGISEEWKEFEDWIEEIGRVDRCGSIKPKPKAKANVAGVTISQSNVHDRLTKQNTKQHTSDSSGIPMKPMHVLWWLTISFPDLAGRAKCKSPHMQSVLPRSFCQHSTLDRKSKQWVIRCMLNN